MSSDSWEGNRGTIGNKYIWKEYSVFASELQDPKTGEHREKLGITLYRTGNEKDPIAYYPLGLTYWGDTMTPAQEKKRDHFIEQLQEATNKGQDIQFLKRKKLLLIVNPEKGKSHKVDTSYNDKCPPGYEYVKAYHKSNGDYTKGYCRKKVY